MKNFKEIAEECLAGNLSGTFKNRQGDSIPSDMLHRFNSAKYPYIYWENYITTDGTFFYNSERISKYDIVDFIPNNMQKQIKIDIPEGKVPVMEQTEKGVFITWKEKELTYDDITNHIWEQGTQIGVLTSTVINGNTNKFSKKVDVLRKLTNIRNYFGKPDNMLEGWCILKHSLAHKLYVDKMYCAAKHQVVFAKKEHAEQAIKMLGDELKYLFEPW